MTEPDPLAPPNPETRTGELKTPFERRPDTRQPDSLIAATSTPREPEPVTTAPTPAEDTTTTGSEPNSGPVGTAPTDHEMPSRGDRILTIVTYVALATLLTTLGVSYARALNYPGEASVAVRTVDWIRDHGGGPVVDAAENWWYSHHHDTTPARLVPGAAATGANAPTALHPIGAFPVAGDGEGTWESLATGRDDQHAGYATYLRPDPEHPDITAAVARFDQRLVSTQLVAGTREPAPDPAPGRGQVPEAMRPRLVATFNSGYKALDSNGGYYADQQQLQPLREGAASAVIDDSGTLTVNQWGRDAHLNPHVTAVRQNLALIVDDGHPVPGLEDNPDNRWGSTGNQHQYTWRSALGSDTAGNLYYVAGDQLTLTTLARALSATGAVRGMELDIHPNMVHLFTYRHDTAKPTPAKLLDTMRGPADRYLTPDRRDFFAITRR